MGMRGIIVRKPMIRYRSIIDIGALNARGWVGKGWHLLQKATGVRSIVVRYGELAERVSVMPWLISISYREIDNPPTIQPTHCARA